MDITEQTDLLTAEQEQQLARTIEIGLLAAHRLVTTGRGLAAVHGQASATEAELTQLVREGEAARQRFLGANLGLVGLVANTEARRRGLPAEDLFQEGVLGLLDGLRRYDHRRGIRFASYALIWIRSAVQTAVNHRCGEVDLCGVRADQVRMVRAIRNRLVLELGRESGVDEVAAQCGRAPSWVAERWDARRPVSLSSATGGTIDVADELSTRGFDEVVDGPVTVSEDMLAVLGALEREVVRRRFGFGGATQSYREISLALGLSLSAARRTELRALDRLRSRCCTGTRAVAA